ncbi:Ca2+ regulator and membrane fusion protein Fig1-domain-containing protein [Xylaria flabelliformis]|nr:Ca2+ regulator and membrane fusion protein Fig1-domain-containing protein [Xylaria flabelliformis]
MSASRFIPRLGYNHLLLILSVIPIFFWSFILAGCTSSNGLRNVYLFALSYKKGPAPRPIDPLLINGNITQALQSQISESANIIQEVRVGYLALCVAFDSGVWSCGANIQELVVFVSDGNGDPLNLLRLAERVRTGTFFYALIVVALVLTFICVCLLGSLLSRQKESENDSTESKPFPSMLILRSAILISTLATLTGLVSAFWQHIGGAGASTLTRLLTYDLVEAQVGPTSVALGWTAAAINAIVTFGVLVIYLSIKVLAELGEPLSS